MSAAACGASDHERWRQEEVEALARSLTPAEAVSAIRLAALLSPAVGAELESLVNEHEFERRRREGRRS